MTNLADATYFPKEFMGEKFNNYVSPSVKTSPATHWSESLSLSLETRNPKSDGEMWAANSRKHIEKSQDIYPYLLQVDLVRAEILPSHLGYVLCMRSKFSSQAKT